MPLKDFFNIAKNDPYNKAMDKWRSLKSLKLSENQDKYISVSLEVIELCKSGIIKSPGWGDQYILLANAYYSLATAFPDIYGYKYLLLAKETIDKWKTDKELIKKENQVNGFTMLNLINNEIKNLSQGIFNQLTDNFLKNNYSKSSVLPEEPNDSKESDGQVQKVLKDVINYNDSILDFSPSGRATMTDYCNNCLKILNSYKTLFDLIPELHTNLQGYVKKDSEVYSEFSLNIKKNLSLLQEWLSLLVDITEPDEMPGSSAILFRIMQLEGLTNSFAEIYTKFVDTLNLDLYNSATPIIEEIPKMLDKTFSEIQKVMKQIE
ncbi:MAG: hypothetical protein C0391_03645 [Anaerolinea sp.]|nr:hypothetical protein [Anaerolinea sp.]